METLAEQLRGLSHRRNGIVATLVNIVVTLFRIMPKTASKNTAISSTASVAWLLVIQQRYSLEAAATTLGTTPRRVQHMLAGLLQRQAGRLPCRARQEFA
jgi:hypothetical protein